MLGVQVPVGGAWDGDWVPSLPLLWRMMPISWQDAQQQTLEELQVVTRAWPVGERGYGVERALPLLEELESWHFVLLAAVIPWAAWLGVCHTQWHLGS